ncbi:hypothetical protein EJB05_50535 [Eragrostis curvula]|uniref:Protein kinase domain-containing protein n=1 Tax=Eragrostis curvula TaxID=38414 RepID=A0A5J9SY40_9POAL|nr:hypothetical protein EJB05_50535 [Eragrostis curvula]
MTGSSRYRRRESQQQRGIADSRPPPFSLRRASRTCRARRPRTDSHLHRFRSSSSNPIPSKAAPRSPIPLKNEFVALRTRQDEVVAPLLQAARFWVGQKGEHHGVRVRVSVSSRFGLFLVSTGSDDEHPSFNLNVETFTFSELSAATANFSENRQIGSGSSGQVYEGLLPRFGKVAVKRLSFGGSSRHGIEQRKNEFLKEVYALNSMDHPNIIKLIGCCSEGMERLLVYEYMPMGTLRKCLSVGKVSKEALAPKVDLDFFISSAWYNIDVEIDLDWKTRMNIALGAARGLEQLHLRANPPIIHRDFKASNILLDKDFQPKVSDFGAAKIAPAGDELFAHTVGMKGTPGYIAPEYALCSSLSIRSDIYSFGVVLLEIITGRKAIDNTRREGGQNLAFWARDKLNDPNNCEELLDLRLRGRVSVDVLSMALAVAKNCIMESDVDRPEIQGVIDGLLCVISKSCDLGASSSSSASRQGVSLQET